MNFPSSIKSFLCGQVIFILFAFSACAVTEKASEIQKQESAPAANILNEPVLPEKFPSPKDYS